MSPRAWPLLALVLLAGCLSVPEQKEPQCRESSDCEQAAGEVCEEGVCWGDPPQLPLAAIVGPPGDAKDLVPAEIPELVIPEHGWMGDLVLGTPVTLRGRVLRECILPCPDTPVEATISVTRPSSFVGGPGLSIVERTSSDGSFVLYLPLTRTSQGTRPDDPPYTVVIAPADRGAVRSSMAASAADAEELPPLVRSIVASRDTMLNFRLPSTALPTIDGRVLNGQGLGLAGYRVVARGRWAEGDPEAEVSTVAITAPDGSYHLTLAENVVGKVTVRAEPPSATTGAGTLELAEVDATGAVTDAELRLPAAERPAVPVVLTVEGQDSGGAPLSGEGVMARLTHELVSGTQTTRYQVEGPIRANSVTFLVVPGVVGQDFTYRLRMLPPVDSQLTALFDQPLAIGAGGALAPIRLTQRVRVVGVVLDDRGQPFKGVAVTARPSLSFLQELSPIQRGAVGELGATTATTSKDGEFALWADQFLAGLPVRYSFTFQPPADELSPTWTSSRELTMPAAGTASVDIGELVTPEASNVHGRISNPRGRPVAKGRVLIYRLDSTCMAAQTGCDGTATLLGRGVADDEGVVRISLPKSL